MFKPRPQILKDAKSHLTSMDNCKFCGAIIVEWKTKSEPDGRQSRFGKHKDGNCEKYIARKLSLHQQQSTWQGFTTPEKCDCGRECFYWRENEKRKMSKLCFDELGPPWFKHDCDERREKHPKPPYQWEIEGYEPCVIEEVDSRFICDHELVVQVCGLKSGRKLALEVKKDITSFIYHLHQPFHFRSVDNKQLWELNTYRERPDNFGKSSYVPQSYTWPKAGGPIQPPNLIRGVFVEV